MATQKNDDTLALRAQLQPFAALTDVEVVQRVLDGDQPLFELIMRRYNRRLFRVAKGVVKDDALAQDVLQEAYLLAFARLSQFKGPLGLGAWLSRIVVREGLRMLRRGSELELVEVPESIATGDEPYVVAASREGVDLLEAAIEQLPRDYRVVFILREIEELNVAETAASLGVTKGTVKSRLHRAKHALRDVLGSRGGDQLEPFSFAGERCDRIVAYVFAHLGGVVT